MGAIGTDGHARASDNVSVNCTGASAETAGDSIIATTCQQPQRSTKACAPAKFRCSHALDLLIVFADFRLLAEQAVDVGEDRAHVRFRGRALHHDDEFRLVA